MSASSSDATMDRLSRLGVTPDRRFGQSFLVDPFVADAEAALVGTEPPGPVLEIGGGLGTLTEALRRRGIGPLIVLEKDRRLVDELRRRFGEAVDVVEGDALVWPIPAVRAAVGNLPYSVATPILLRLWSARVPVVIAMLQNEVAERLAASPGSRSYGRLSILARWFGRVELQRHVGAEAFVPRPAVESRIVRFVAEPVPFPEATFVRLERVLDALFSGRRKQLGNLLGRLTDRPSDLAEQAEWPSGWATLRPENLEPEAFFRLAERWTPRSGPPSKRGGSADRPSV